MNIETVIGVQLGDTNNNNTNTNSMETSPYRQGKLQLSYRITHPWLQLQAFYNFTEAAQAEKNQKKRLEEYTRKVRM